jgi:hypothetical protein
MKRHLNYIIIQKEIYGKKINEARTANKWYSACGFQWFASVCDS